MTTPTPLAYTTLEAVKGLLDTTSVRPARDEVLTELIHEVSERISADLGVRWGGAAQPGLRTVSVVDGLVAFLIPATEVIDVLIGEDVVPASGWAIDPAFQAASGAVRAIRLTSPRIVRGTVTVRAIWADRPGGAVPARIRSFATWAVKQTFQIREAGVAAERGPDGVTISYAIDPWSAKGEWPGIMRTYAVRETGVC